MLCGGTVTRPSQRRAGRSNPGAANRSGAARTSAAAATVTSAGSRRKARPSTLLTAMQCRMPKKMTCCGTSSQVAREISAAAPAITPTRWTKASASTPPRAIRNTLAPLMNRNAATMTVRNASQPGWVSSGQSASRSQVRSQLK